MTVAQIGYGSELTYSGAAAGSVGQLVDVDAPSIEIGADDTSNSDSPNAAKEFIPKLIDPGSITSTHVFSAAILASLATLYRQVLTWTVLAPDGSSFTCDGFITKVSKGSKLEEHETLNLEIKLSGLPTYEE